MSSFWSRWSKIATAFNNFFCKPWDPLGHTALANKEQECDVGVCVKIIWSFAASLRLIVTKRENPTARIKSLSNPYAPINSERVFICVSLDMFTSGPPDELASIHSSGCYDICDCVSCSETASCWFRGDEGSTSKQTGRVYGGVI